VEGEHLIHHSIESSVLSLQMSQTTGLLITGLD